MRPASLSGTAAAVLVVTTGWALSQSAWESLHGGAAARGPVPTSPVWLAGANLLGNATAKVVVIEYSDFECPYCGRFAREVLPGLEQRYVTPGVVMLAFRQLPLQSIHPYALRAAEAAECAAEHGKFRQMHDDLFGNQGDLSEAGLLRRAVHLDLPLPEFSACLDGVGRQEVLEDVSQAETLAINQTPTFFVGRVEGPDLVRVDVRLEGFQPLSAFARAIESLVKPVP